MLIKHIKKTSFRYKILNCYFTTLECKVFRICNFLNGSKSLYTVNHGRSESHALTASVWTPYSSKYIKKLEAIQKHGA